VFTSVDVTKLNGNPLVPLGPAHAPPTTAVMPVPAVVGAVPDFTVVESVIVVVETAVTRATKPVGPPEPSVYTETKLPTATPAETGLPDAGVKTPVPLFHPPFVYVTSGVVLASAEPSSVPA